MGVVERACLCVSERDRECVLSVIESVCVRERECV